MWNVGFLVDFFTELPKCGVGGNHNVVRLSLKHNNHLDVHVCVCVRGGKGGEGRDWHVARTQNNSPPATARPRQAEPSRAKPGFRVVRVRSFVRSFVVLPLRSLSQTATSRTSRHAHPALSFFSKQELYFVACGVGELVSPAPKNKKDAFWLCSSPHSLSGVQGGKNL
jgi:hypothetical protein